MPRSAKRKASIEQHRSVEYAPVHFLDQANLFSVSTEADGSRVTILGVCPGCGGRTETVWVLGVGGHKGVFRGSARQVLDAVPDRTRLINCDCGHAHLNRPDSAPFLGCGAHWLVELP